MHDTHKYRLTFPNEEGRERHHFSLLRLTEIKEVANTKRWQVCSEMTTTSCCWLLRKLVQRLWRGFWPALWKCRLLRMTVKATIYRVLPLGKRASCILWPNLRSHRPSFPQPYPLCQGTKGVIPGGGRIIGRAGRPDTTVSDVRGDILVSNTLNILSHYLLCRWGNWCPRTLVWCQSQNWNQSHLPRLFLVHLLSGLPDATPASL